VWRDRRPRFPQHQAVPLQCLQGLAQHLLADSVDPAPQRVEADRSVQQRRQRERAPAAGRVLHRLAGWAVLREDVEQQLVHGIYGSTYSEKVLTMGEC
jgi:hypothetical protein